MAQETRPKGYPKLKNYKPSQFMLPTSHYDKVKADRAVKFIENLCHTKGKWCGKRFWLLPWQEQLIRDIFGIVKADGNRQFRTVFVEICKKVGKSELAAAIALYLLYEDGTVKVSVKKSNEEYMKNCNFKVKSNADKLGCGENYKLQLKYINSGEFRIFPMCDLKRYTVPSKAVFEKHQIYETRGRLTDMFGCVKVKFVYKEGEVHIQLEKNEEEYAKYCAFKIINEKDTYKPNEELFIELEYDENGITELGMEPSTYIKKCKVPAKKVLEENEVRKILIKNCFLLKSKEIMLRCSV